MRTLASSVGVSVFVFMTSACSGGKDDAIVANDALASILVTPELNVLGVGRTAQLAAVAKGGDGATLSGVSVTWSSADTHVATVSTSGLVTAVGPGETTISAANGEIRGRATVRVRGDYDLNVTLAGAGAGAVTSNPAGITCGTTCNASFDIGTSVSLTAQPTTGSELASWDGACVGTGACVVTMDDDRTVTANFRKQPVLSVTVTGDGSVTSTPPGITCGADGGTCSAAFATGTRVTLEVNQESGSSFTIWSGACAGDEHTCELVLQSDVSVGAAFDPWPTLTVTPTGPGLVKSQPVGIDCRASGGNCTAGFSPKFTVKLTATPDDGDLFVGWGGDCSATPDAPCELSMSKPRTATATFVAGSTVALTVAGPGTVSSDPPGIDCDAAASSANDPGCTHTFPAGSTVALTATPDDGNGFGGWGGDCSGTTACALPMTTDQSVTATFLAGLPVAVSTAGTGHGSLTSEPEGIACVRDADGESGTCAGRFTQGSTVVLTADPDDGSVFGGWTGCPQPDGATCTFTVAGGETVGATFTLERPRLTVTGAGEGQVTSTPGGISCYTQGGGTCEAQFDFDQFVTLAAFPNFGYFVGWSGACSGRAKCELTMDKAKTVGAEFTSFRVSVLNDPLQRFSVKAGETRAIDVQVTLSAGVGIPVDLRIDNTLPTGVTATFDPPTVTPTGMTKMRITAAADMPPVNEHRVDLRASVGTGQPDEFAVTTSFYMEVRSQNGTHRPTGIVLEPGEKTVLVTEPDRLVRIDVATRATLGTVASGLGATPGSIVLEAGGTALVASGANLWRVTPTTGALSRIATPTTGALVLASARGLVLRDAGTAVVTDCEDDDCTNKGRILLVTLATGAVTRVNAGAYLKAPRALALEASGQTVLVAERQTGRLVRVNLGNGSTTIVATGLTDIEGVAIESGGASVLVSHGAWIERVDLARGIHTPVVAVSNTCCAIPGLMDLAIETGGAMALVNDQQPFGASGTEAGRVVRFEVAAPIAVLAPSRLSGDVLYAPAGVALEDATHALVSDCGALGCQLSGRVVKVDLTSGEVTALTTAALDTPRAIVKEAAGTALVVERGAGRLLRLDPVSGALTVVASGLARTGNGPEGVALEPGGATALVTAGDILMRVALADGGASTVASISNTCCNIPGVTGVAVAPDGSFALVLDHGPFTTGPSGRLVKVTLGALPVTTIVARGFTKPLSVTIGADASSAIVTDDGEPGTGRLLRVDLATGSYEVIAGGLGLPRGAAFEAGDDSLLVTDAGTNGNRLVRVTLDETIAPASRVQALRLAGGMALEPAGTALVVDCGDQLNGCLTDGRLLRLDLSSLTQTQLYPVGPTGLNQPAGVVAEDETHALVAHCGPANGDCNADSRLVRITLTGTPTLTTVSTGYNHLAAIHRDSETSVLGIENRTRIVRVSLLDGSFELLASGFYDAENLEPEPGGTHAILAHALRLSRVELATGKVQLLVDLPSAPYPAFALESAGTALITQPSSPYGAAGVWFARVVLATGGITIHTSGGFTEARQMLLVPGGTSALVLERQAVTSAIMRISVP